MTDKPLFGWLQSLYPLWAGARHRGGVPVGVGRPRRAGAVGLHDVDATTCTSTRAAPATCSAPRSTPPRDLGVRFHPTRGSMSLSVKDGGLPPDDVVADDDEILAASEDAVAPPPRPHATGR